MNFLYYYFTDYNICLLEKYLKYQFYVKNLRPDELRLFHFFIEVNSLCYIISIFTYKRRQLQQMFYFFHQYMLQVSTVMTILRHFSTRL